VRNPTVKDVLVVAALIAGVAAVAVLGPKLCSTKKKRAPGPLVVWLQEEEGDRDKLQYFADKFEEANGTPVEVEFIPRYELARRLADHPEQVLGRADVVEADLFELEATAPSMQDVTSLFATGSDAVSICPAAAESGEFEGQRKFVPWRLSWPTMLAKREYGQLTTWNALADAAAKNPGTLFFPALNDREVFALTMALVWAYGGDPLKPDEQGFQTALAWLARVSPLLDQDSRMMHAREVPGLPRDKRPGIFFEWPEGIIPLVLDASVLEYLKPLPLPCGPGGKCPVFAFGRYLAIPNQAPHREDALRFIEHLVSASVQREMIYASPWLPVRADGWSELGPRKTAYEGCLLRARDLVPAPRPLNRIEPALAKAAKMVLVEGKSPEEATAAYKARLASGPSPGGETEGGDQ
jgi:ABC-type glycerol-3-phosphate transport system substrate-binding protein